MTRSSSMQMERNPNWKGYDAPIHYSTLHDWVKRRLLKPEICQLCKSSKPYDLANINNTYNRNLENWIWLCRSCHMKSDGRLKNLKRGGKIKGQGQIDMSDRKCSICNSNKTRIRSTENNRPHWFYVKGKISCRNCYSRIRRNNNKS